jgi:hypothetical protein
MDEQEKACEMCRHWDPIFGDPPKGFGYCRRYAPGPIGIRGTAKRFVTVWYETEWDDFCSDFEGK